MPKPTEKDLQEAVTAANVRATSAETRADSAELELTQERKRADKAEGEVDSLREKIKVLEKSKIDPARLDAKDTEIRQLNEKLQKETRQRLDAQDPDRLREAVRSRVKIEAAASAVMKDLETFDDFTDRELQISVIERLQGVRLDEEKSNDYVAARFDAAVEGWRAGNTALDRVRDVVALEDKGQPHVRADSGSAREAMIKRNREAWSNPDPFTGKSKGA